MAVSENLRQLSSLFPMHQSKYITASNQWQPSVEISLARSSFHRSDFFSYFPFSSSLSAAVLWCLLFTITSSLPYLATHDTIISPSLCLCVSVCARSRVFARAVETLLPFHQSWGSDIANALFCLIRQYLLNASLIFPKRAIWSSSWVWEISCHSISGIISRRIWFIEASGFFKSPLCVLMWPK